MNTFLPSYLPDPIQVPKGCKVMSKMMMHGSSYLPDPIQVPRGCNVVSEMMMHGPLCREPPVQIPNVHLENKKRINYCERDKLEVIVNLPEQKKQLLQNGLCTTMKTPMKRCKSPVEVRIVKDQILPTYQAACEALGLRRKSYCIFLMNGFHAVVLLAAAPAVHVTQALGTSNFFNEKSSCTEVVTLNGHVESVVKYKGLDIDTTQQHYIV
nr:hypothetical protein [Tanacetum cinerariifolium]